MSEDRGVIGGGDDVGGMRADQIVLMSDRGLPHHRAQIEATAGMAPDLVVEIGHEHCGQDGCRRPQGPVRIAVTWLDDPAADMNPDDLQYRGDIASYGPVCQQVVDRARQAIESLYTERREQQRRSS